MFARLTHLLLFAHMVLLDEVRNVRISILNDLLHPDVGFLSIKHLIDKKAVDFVEYKASFDFGLPCLPDDSRRLRTNAFDAIDQDEGAIGQADGRADLDAEVYMPRRINEINAIILLVGLATLHERWLLLRVDDGDGGGFHGDLALLLILARVEIARLACHLLTDDIVGCNQAVTKSGLAVVHMR